MSAEEENKSGSHLATNVSCMLSGNMLTYFSDNSKESTVVSPFGLLSALSMLIVGMTDDTLKEVQKGLSFKDKYQLFDDVTKLSKLIGSDISLNNFVLIKDTAGVYQEYKDTVKQLGSLLDFKQNEIGDLVQRVNNIVSHNTSGKIKNLIKPGDINQGTFLVLLNTLYMDNKWNIKFKKRDTKKEQFDPLFGLSRSIEMMNIEEKFGYFENETMQALKLNYQLGDLSMIVVLPKQRKTNPYYLSEDTLTQCMKSFTKESVNVKFPKFELSSELDFVPFFKFNKMGHMFENLHADDMIKRNNNNCVSTIRQNNFIKIDEDGTRFISASAVTVVLKGMHFSPDKDEAEKVYNFHADHPFTYYIVHDSGLVLCCGVYL